MKKYTCLFFAFLLTFLSRSNAQDFNPQLAERYQHVLDSMTAEFNLKGASSAILMPEKGLWTGSAGFSHDNVEITADMLFRDVSNTPLFVSAAIMQLVDEGTIALDEPISKWLKPYEHIDGNITIRQLLNHTSGVDNYFLYFDPRDNPSQHLTPDSILAYVKEPNFAPGTDWGYSDTNTILLALIINKASGIDTIAHTFRERFFDPLGLQNTFFEGEEAVTGTFAHGWDDWNGDGQLQDVFNYPQEALISGVWAAGALVANAEDMVTWVKELCGGQLLSKDRLQEMLTFTDLTPANSTYYKSFALGIGGINYNNNIVWGIGGYHLGFTSQTVYDPEYNLTLSIAINQSNGPFDTILRKLHQESKHYYNFPFDKVHPKTVKLNHSFISKGEHLIVKSEVNNLQDNNVFVFAHYFNADSSIMDSVQMFDDGLHMDSLAGDGFFGVALTTPNVEDNFSLKVSSKDMQSGYRHLSPITKEFTTKGPVSIDHFEITSADTTINPGDLISFELFLKNNGKVASVANLETKLTPLDSCLLSVNLGKRTIDTLSADQVAEHNRSFRLQIEDDCNHGLLAVQVDIYQNENLFWIDTLYLDVVSSIKDVEPVTANKFNLHQNYPNPFNPSTRINYELKTSSNVNLTIYDMNGRKIKTLLNENQNAGVHSITFNAEDLVSGVYMYRLSAGSFLQSRKMLLLR